jgi:hypothetical protein
MCGSFRALVLFVGLLALGCHHDKYHMTPPKVEEYSLPPDEPRYNLPDTAGYRKPAPKKEEKTLMGGPDNAMRPGVGGF